MEKKTAFHNIAAGWVTAILAVVSIVWYEGADRASAHAALTAHDRSISAINIEIKELHATDSKLEEALKLHEAVTKKSQEAILDLCRKILLNQERKP